MNLAAYLRVSTDRQADEGLGLDVQRQVIRKWARANGHKITAWHADEGISGSNGIETRLALGAALNDIAQHRVDGLVFYRLDRLARDMMLQEQLLRDIASDGGRVFSTFGAEQDNIKMTHMTPTGKWSGASSASIADRERKLIALRLAAGKRRKHEQGGYAGYGAPPIGYTAVGKELVADDDEQATLTRIHQLRGEGRTIRQIIAVLDAEGRRTKRGASWHPTTVARILRSPEQHQADIERARKTKELATRTHAERA